MNTSQGKKRPKKFNNEPTKTIPDEFLTPSAASASPSDRCWKCKGKGLKFQKSTQLHDGPPCKVCNGEGIRKRSKRSKLLASAPGKILNLRGYPEDHSLRKIYPDGFAGPRAFWGSAGDSRLLRRRLPNHGCARSLSTVKDDDDDDDDIYSLPYGYLPKNLCPREGEVIGSLGCGDWRIYQIADGNKLTVDDFVCAWVAAEEMRKRGYGVNLHRGNAVIKDDDDGCFNDAKMFGGRTEKTDKQKDQQNKVSEKILHADIGTGCGSVLMMIAWAFLGEITSIGIEAQSISFNCLKKGLEWNLGRDGTSPHDTIQIRQNDLRTWDGFGVKYVQSTKIAAAAATKLTGDENVDQSEFLRAPYHLITGTPPYFPLDSFVASQNHEQKVRCRVPTRGGAPDYIEAASRFLMEEQSQGVFCMVEAAFDKAEAGVLRAVKKFNMRVRRRVDVITRSGLPPRFSCWVMTKMNSSEIEGQESQVSLNDGSICREEANETTKIIEKKNKEESDVFPIETLTLRNADLTRTHEYTKAMEIMGWVDFEKSKNKNAKSLNEISDQN